MPDLSFGTHFFQDLVEAGIRYLPLFPGEPGQVLQRRVPPPRPEHPGRPPARVRAPLAASSTSSTSPQATDGLVLQVLMNADLDEAVGYFAAPTQGQTHGAGAPRPTSAGHRGPLALAPADGRAHRRGGGPRALRRSRRMYVFGSTKNATAGPGQRHRPDRPRGRRRRGARRQLEVWLEGWSLCLSEMNYLRTGYRTRRPAGREVRHRRRLRAARRRSRRRSAPSPTRPAR